MKRIIVDGWNIGFNKVGFTKLSRYELGSTLTVAKGMTDALLAGRPVVFEVEDSEVQRLALTLHELGANFRVDGEVPTLLFTCDFDERTAWEVEQKGWFDGAQVTFLNGVVISLSFWDPVRLSQESAAEFDRGKSCFSEPALIIVPRVTRESMGAAIQELAANKYFDRLIALRRK